jgi:hypothetical protein
LLSSTFGRKRDIDTIDAPADGGKKKKALSTSINQELKKLGASDQFIKEVVPLMNDDMVQDLKHLLNDQPEQIVQSGGDGDDLAETEKQHDEETLLKMADDDDEFSAFLGMSGDVDLTETEEKHDGKTLLDELFDSLDLPVQNQYSQQKKEELPWKYYTELNGKKYTLEENGSNKEFAGSVSVGVGETNVKVDEVENQAHQNKMDSGALSDDDFLPSFLDDEFDRIQSQDMMNGLISSYELKW